MRKERPGKDKSVMGQLRKDNYTDRSVIKEPLFKSEFLKAREVHPPSLANITNEWPRFSPLSQTVGWHTPGREGNRVQEKTGGWCGCASLVTMM